MSLWQRITKWTDSPMFILDLRSWLRFSALAVKNCAIRKDFNEIKDRFCMIENDRNWTTESSYVEQGLEHRFYGVRALVVFPKKRGQSHDARMFVPRRPQPSRTTRHERHLFGFHFSLHYIRLMAWVLENKISLIARIWRIKVAVVHEGRSILSTFLLQQILSTFPKQNCLAREL